jgi:hypothetical protein
MMGWSSGFKKITDPEEILKVLRLYMSEERPGEFIPNIRTKKNVVWQGSAALWNIEGSRPMSITGTEDSKLITLTNGDSEYTLATGSLQLDDIDYLEI